jgi:hypothetical protein
MSTSTAAVTRTAQMAARPTLRSIRMIMDPDELQNASPRSLLKTRASARRLASFHRTWIFVGVVAEAEILLGDRVQHISSSGLWGIESFAHAHLRREGEAQFAELIDILDALGITVDLPFTAVPWSGR